MAKYRTSYIDVPQCWTVKIMKIQQLNQRKIIYQRSLGTVPLKIKMQRLNTIKLYIDAPLLLEC